MNADDGKVTATEAVLLTILLWCADIVNVDDGKVTTTEVVRLGKILQLARMPTIAVNPGCYFSHFPTWIYFPYTAM